MKLKLYYLALVSSMLLLQACGGGGLAGGDDKDIDPIYPEAGVEDESARPRPPENAVVITTDEHFIYDAANQPVLLRGINHLYAADPVTRIDGITAIKDVGSNVVRLQLDETTTEVQFEGAMAKVVENGLIAVVTLTAEGNQLTCSEDRDYLLSTVDELWFKRFLPILVQDRFQSHLMLNIANGWGPMDIFNQDSFGYQEYIDTYKALIRKFRNAGFKFPIVIDAPSCGQDFNAFLGGRSRELMAADTEKNLVFGVHVDGPRWDSSDEIVNAATQLYNEKVPFIVTGFTGSGYEGMDEASINHLDVMMQSVGDPAMAFDLPWVSTSDSAAYVMTLDEPLDLIGGASLATNVFIDKIYAENDNSTGNWIPTGKLSFELYVRDGDGNTLRAGGSNATVERTNQWVRVSFSLPKAEGDIDPENLMGGAESFDLTNVTQIGINLLANGKPVALKKPIKFDNLSIFPGVPPMFVANFDADVEGWTVEWGDYTLSHFDSSLSLMPASEGNQISVGLTGWKGGDLSSWNFNKDLEVTLRMFFPAEYATDVDSIYFQMWGRFTEDWTYQPQTDINTSQIQFGEWTDVKVTLRWSDGDVALKQSVGIQIGGFAAGKTQPILIDSISVSDANGIPTKIITALQHESRFSRSVEAFAENWNTKATVENVDGELHITPLWQNPAGEQVDDVVVLKADITSIATIDVSGPITYKVRIFVPESYAGSNLEFELFTQDFNWGRDTQFPGRFLTIDDFTPGEWTSFEFYTDTFAPDFARTQALRNFGFRWRGVNFDGGTVKIDDLEIYGNTEVDDAQPILLVDFSDPAQLEAFVFDFAGGSFSESAVSAAKYSDWRVAPFGWAANSWKGHAGDSAVLDLSLDEDMVNLTERGEEIVNGAAGIVETSMPANFVE